MRETRPPPRRFALPRPAHALRSLQGKLFRNAQPAGVALDQQSALDFAGQTDLDCLVHPPGAGSEHGLEHFRPVGVWTN